MKSKKLTLAAMVMLAAGMAWGQANVSYTNIVGATIADGNPVGLSDSENVAGLPGYVSQIQLRLNVTGGFNGDLYAYLLGPNGSLAVLLNRVGVGSANLFGYSDSGFNITLAQGYNNIHNYQTVGGYDLSGGSLWSPDGRNISPLSTPRNAGDFDTASTSSNFNLYNDIVPNGQWTLFIADLSAGGGQSTLVSWGLTIVTVPEPQTWLMLAGGLGMLFAFQRRRK